ncbi:hypothetical protein LEP1GSC166_2250 [Leptospira kirschneri]|nr:hypothetical protein LEP1GSC198_1604 [Leptospira kirschneri str. JB]EMK07135.1 hypothetical protein LEP1GSC166_2250 [Leptospira kirschneri]
MDLFLARTLVVIFRIKFFQKIEILIFKMAILKMKEVDSFLRKIKPDSIFPRI